MHANATTMQHKLSTVEGSICLLVAHVQLVGQALRAGDLLIPAAHVTCSISNQLETFGPNTV